MSDYRETRFENIPTCQRVLKLRFGEDIVAVVILDGFAVISRPPLYASAKTTHISDSEGRRTGDIL